MRQPSSRRGSRGREQNMGRYYLCPPKKAHAPKKPNLYIKTPFTSKKDRLEGLFHASILPIANQS